MRIPRLKPFVIAIIGVVICLGSAAYIWYQMITPTTDLIKAATARYDAAFPDSTPSVQAAARKDKMDATKMVAAVQAQWDQKQRAIMPPWDVSDRNKAWDQERMELTKNLGEDLLKWVPRTGVIMTNGINLPEPPVSPNLITAAPMVINLGGFTVIGEFRKILSHIVKWNDFNRLVMIDRLALHGNSPFMRGTYTATVFIFPQNGDKLGPLIPKAGGQGPGGGGGGRANGPPPGFGG